jgi:hypothetical protein
MLEEGSTIIIVKPNIADSSLILLIPSRNEAYESLALAWVLVSSMFKVQ